MTSLGEGKEDSVNRDQIRQKLEALKNEVKKRIGDTTQDRKPHGGLDEQGARVQRALTELEEQERRDPPSDR